MTKQQLKNTLGHWCASEVNPPLNPPVGCWSMFEGLPQLLLVHVGTAFDALRLRLST